MSGTLTEPRKEALQNVADGIVYRRQPTIVRGRTKKQATWMLDGSWQPPSQQPYSWLFQENYIELLSSSWRARLSPKGQELLDNIKGQQTL